MTYVERLARRAAGSTLEFAQAGGLVFPPPTPGAAVRSSADLGQPDITPGPAVRPTSADGGLPEEPRPATVSPRSESAAALVPGPTDGFQTETQAAESPDRPTSDLPVGRPGERAAEAGPPAAPRRPVSHVPDPGEPAASMPTPTERPPAEIVRRDAAAAGVVAPEPAARPQPRPQPEMAEPRQPSSPGPADGSPAPPLTAEVTSGVKTDIGAPDIRPPELPVATPVPTQDEPFRSTEAPMSEHQPITVHIGTIEIEAEPPRSPPPRRSRLRGFGSYAAARQYDWGD